MSTTSSVTLATSEQLSIKNSTTDSSKKESDVMGKDAFMQLLVTQMKYQDPLNPMDNSEMLAQLAQFTALEQMMNVAQASEKQLANSMIGQYVEYLYKDSATGNSSYQVGKVDYVKFDGDTTMLGIGDIEVSIEDVYQVINSEDIQASSSAFDVIGKTVQATTTEKAASGKEQNIIIEGEVQSIQMKDGKPYVVIGTGKDQKVIPYENVQSIVENTSMTGKEVTGTYTDENGETQTTTGIVEYIKIDSDGTYLYVNGQYIDFYDVTNVK